jgi:hypothetical protein
MRWYFLVVSIFLVLLDATEYNMNPKTINSKLAESLVHELTDRYGPMLGGANLSKVMGYPSSKAFAQALTRGQLPIPVFPLVHRRGKFALTKDVAQWMAEQRQSVSSNDAEELLPKIGGET